MDIVERLRDDELYVAVDDVIAEIEGLRRRAVFTEKDREQLRQLAEGEVWVEDLLDRESASKLTRLGFVIVDTMDLYCLDRFGRALLEEMDNA